MPDCASKVQHQNPGFAADRQGFAESFSAPARRHVVLQPSNADLPGWFE
jgi:hypothetical protein